MQNGRDIPCKLIDFSVSDVGACSQAIFLFRIARKLAPQFA
jgi:hypothetical protein